MDEKINLEEIITKDMIIETKHFNAYDNVSTKVIDFYDEFIEVSLVDDYLDRLVMVGDKLFCKAGLYEKYIYIMDAEVFNVKILARTLVLKITKMKMLKNTRGNVRYDVFLCSGIRKKDTEEESYSVIVNVSLGGFGIVSCNCFEIDNIVDIVIYLPGLDVIKAECSVKWKKDENETRSQYGLEITSMDYFDKIKYEDYITSIGRKLFYIK